MSDSASNKEERNRVGWIGAYLTILPLLLLLGLLVFWPEPRKENGDWVWGKSVRLVGGEISNEARLLIIVTLAGALGACVHAMTSFASYVGNRTLVPSWNWWYFLRPLIGFALAVVFYFVIRGGLLSAGASAGEVNPFGIAAVAGLVGLFSKQAIDKLRETFDNLFRTAQGKGDDARADKLRPETSIADVMIPINKITFLQFAEGEAEANVPITRLHEQYGGIVTRLPIVDQQCVVRHVVHQSLVYKFVARKAIEEGLDGEGIKKLNLKDFLEWNDIKKIVSDSIAFVPMNATLADARKAMEQVPGCQDVFVTEHGSRDEPVKGWLTNVDIGRLVEA